RSINDVVEGVDSVADRLAYLAKKRCWEMFLRRALSSMLEGWWEKVVVVLSEGLRHMRLGEERISCEVLWERY
ncbi:hypothetical protein A2U01_0086419, partial [Trifolium medium]|nr:hypothetical protein [Trifolium medium]